MAEDKPSKKPKISLKLSQKGAVPVLAATKVVLAKVAPPATIAAAKVALVSSATAPATGVKITIVTPQRMSIPVAVAAKPVAVPAQAMQEEESSTATEPAIDIGSDPVVEYELDDEFEAMD